jgi:hypothetical protein
MDSIPDGRHTTIIEGHGTTYGCIQDTASYRTEVCRMIAILAIYSLIVKLYNWRAKDVDLILSLEYLLDPRP